MKTYIVPKYLWVIQNFEIGNMRYISNIEHLFDYGLVELENLENYIITEYRIPALYLRIHEIHIEGKHTPVFYAFDTYNRTFLARNDTQDMALGVKWGLERFIVRVLEQVGGRYAEIRANYQDQIFVLPEPYNKPATDKIVVDDVNIEVGDSTLYINIIDLTRKLENEILKDMEEINIDYTKEKTWYDFVSF